MRGSSTPLVIAGGGGGVNRVSSRHAGCDASANTTGNPGYRSWSGGSNGHGALTSTDEKGLGKSILCYQVRFSKIWIFLSLMSQNTAVDFSSIKSNLIPDKK